MNSKRLNDAMKQCKVPNMYEHFGSTKGKVDSGLDSEELNPKLA